MQIAIVNDTLIATEALRRVLNTVPEYNVVWNARNGAEAVSKCAQNTPDLILMDLIMPVMDGVEATRQIMKTSPCAILIVTSTVKGHTSKIFESMGYGALDVVSTPILGRGGYLEGGASLLSKIATIGKLIGKSTSSSLQPLSPQKQRFISSFSPPLVVIGASTGGPQALATILSGLGKDFGAAIVVVQHVDQQFAQGLADWLNAQISLPVKLASVGCMIEVGKVFLASTNNHLILQPNQRLSYTQNPLDYAYRPSVDVFFKSVAQHWQGKGVAVLLTGMGKDGAQGLQILRSTGWHTIAQEKSSCVIYGMPKAAIELGAAVDILPVEAISAAIFRVLRPQISR
ncbi:MAG: chemotaxis response regulator protein-glutamate methylesterase [Coleofasciculaceae cyanobacterium]